MFDSFRSRLRGCLRHMSSTTPLTPKHPALHLLWALPLALFLSYYTLTISVLAYCGFGACTADQAADLGNLPDALAPLGLTVLFIAVPIFAVAWSRSLRLRAVVAVVSGVVVATVGFASLVAAGP